MPALDGGEIALAERVRAKRAKLMELEAALVLSDDTKDSVVGYLIESTLDRLRADTWPANLDISPYA